MPRQIKTDWPAPGAPVPKDLRLAVNLMRAAVRDPISVAEIAQRCGVAERTLRKHFRVFLGVSPARYLRRLRLVAARDALLNGAPGISVTDVAKMFEFNHLGRFSEQYRRHFGEFPSATLRREQAAIHSRPGMPQRYNANPMRIDAPVSGAPRPSRYKPSIAILPCQTSAKLPDLLWVAESSAEAIAAALGSIGSISVRVPKSLRFTGRDPQRLARALNARYYLTGRLDSGGSRLRAILSVVESATGRHVWGDCIDATKDEPLDLQDRIAERVASAIAPRIRDAEIDCALGVLPHSLDAHGLTMRALPLVFSSHPDATQRALEFLHRAIELDPDYCLASALAAWCHRQLVMYNGTSKPGEEKAEAVRLVRRAAIFENNCPIVLASRAAVHTMAGEFDVAEVLVTRALALEPSFAWAWGRSGWLQSYKGNSDTAIQHFRTALYLTKDRAVRANICVGLGSAHFNAGRYDSAARQLHDALHEKPDLWWANRSLSVSQARLGNRLKALESLETLRLSCPDLTVDRVVTSVPFRRDFLERLGNGLGELGLPP